MVIGSLRSLKCVKPNYKGVWKVLVVRFNFFIAYGLGPRPLPHPYVYVIGLGPRPSYIFPLTKTAYEMGK